MLELFKESEILKLPSEIANSDPELEDRLYSLIMGLAHFHVPSIIEAYTV